MLFERYEQKILRLRKVRDTIIRFRFLIISCVALILASIATMLAVNGKITQDISLLKGEYVYGESLTYQSSRTVFDVETRNEYRKVGEEAWTAEEPTLPGEYELRLVSRRTFGAESYGEPFSFKISPRPVKVKIGDEAIVYGEESKVNVELVGEERLDSVRLLYEYDAEHGTVNVSVADGSVVVKDGNGNNTSPYYQFETESKLVYYKKRPVTLLTASAERAYDATALMANDYTIKEGTLAYSDKIADEKIVYTAEAVTVNAYANEVDGESIAIYDAAGKDVTAHYSIKVESGTLKVTHRPLTVTVKQYTKVYDGTTACDTCETFETGLVEGHAISYEKKLDSPIVFGNRSIQISNLKITSGEEDVTQNYAWIKQQEGTVTITKRPLKYSTNSIEDVYKGAAYSDSTVNVDETLLADGKKPLLEGDSVAVSSSTSLLAVGEVDNEVIFRIRSSSGDVTNNYEPIPSLGKIKVNKRPLLVQPYSGSRVYDGTDYYNKNYSLGGMSLASGDTLSVTDYSKIKNVGSVNNELTYEIKNGAGQSTKEYYELQTPSVVTLTVTKRTVSFQTNSSSKVYDGTPLTCQTHTRMGTYDLVSGHKFQADISEITTVGSTSNAWQNIKVVDASDDDAVNANYTLDYRGAGTLTVTRRAIKIQTATDSKTYDGTALFNEGYTLVNGTSLASGEEIEVTSRTEITNYFDASNGQKENVLTVEIKKAGTTDKTTDNYSIAWDKGTLTISKRALTVQTATQSKTYDGAVLYNEGYTLLDGTLVSGETITVTSHTEITNYFDSPNGQKENVLTVEIKKSGGAPSTGNYAITWDKGTISIIPREITIQTATDAKTYDGTALYNEGYTLVDGTTLASGETITVTGHTEITNYFDSPNGRKENVLTVEIKKAGGAPSTGNYAITWQKGTLTISKRALTIQPNSQTKVYDGTPLFDKGYSMHGTSLASCDTLTVTGYTTITNYYDSPNGKIRNELTFTIENAKGVDTKDNYVITPLEGYLTIEKRVVHISATGSTEREYDGKPLTNKQYTLKTGSYTLVSGHSFEAEFSSITIVGSIKNEWKNLRVVDANGDDTVNGNYTLIVDAYGTLTVTKRHVTVQTGDASRKYDGTPLTCTTYQMKYGTSIAPEQRLELIKSAAFTNYYDTNNGVAKNNVWIEYYVYDAENNDVTQYYEFSFENGMLTILQRELSVTTKGASKAYDRTALTKEDAVIGADGLAVGDEISLTYTGSQTLVGQSFNTLDKTKTEISRSGDKKVIENYLISYFETGILEVQKRKVYIQPVPCTRVYDGTVQTIDDNELWQFAANVSEMFLPGDYDANNPLYAIDLIINGSRKDVGVSKTSLTVNSARFYSTWNEATGTADKARYEVDYYEVVTRTGEFIMTKASLKLSSTEVEFNLSAESSEMTMTISNAEYVHVVVGQIPAGYQIVYRPITLTVTYDSATSKLTAVYVDAETGTILSTERKNALVGQTVTIKNKISTITDIVSTTDSTDSILTNFNVSYVQATITIKIN